MHRLLKNSSDDLSELTGRINQKFGGPYHWCLLERESRLQNAYKYTYRNPVMAGLVSRCEEYQFSSLSGLLGQAYLPYPIVEDQMLFDEGDGSVGGALDWLNHANEEDTIEVQRALKKHRFGFEKTYKRIHRKGDFIYWSTHRRPIWAGVPFALSLGILVYSNLKHKSWMFFIAVGIKSSLLLLLLGWGSISQAQVQCRSLFSGLLSSFDRREYQLQNRLEDLNGPVKQGVYDVLGQMQPSGVKIEMVSFMPYVQTALDQKTVLLGTIGIPAEIKPVNVVVAHELGHASFNEHLRIEAGGYQGTYHEIANQVLDADRVIKSNPQLIREFHDLEAQNGRTISNQKYRELLMDLARRYGLEKVHELKNLVGSVQYILFPYNELYADIVAVLVHGQLDIVAETAEVVAERPRRSKDDRPFHPEIRERDFSTIFGFKLWTGAGHHFGNYSLFDPARGAIGRLYLQDLSRLDKPTFLKGFLRATRRHLDQRLERGERHDMQFEADALNREFLAMLVAELRTLGINPKLR